MKETSTIFRIVAIVLIAFFFAFTAQESEASLSEYRFSVGTGSSSDMTGATNIWTATNQNRFHAASGALNIGFTFQFDGVNYTQMQVYTSGALSLGSATLFRYSFNQLGNPSVPVVAPFWDSLAMTGTQGGCYAPKVRYKVFGSAPYRMLVVEWFDQETIWGRGSRGTFEARLYETTGKIEYYYLSMNHCVTCGPPQQIGLCGNTSTSIGIASGTSNFISVTPNSATATSSSAVANNAIDLNNVNTRISANVLYTFTPNIQLTAPATLDFGIVSRGITTTRCVTVGHVGTVGQLLFPPGSISGASEFTIGTTPASVMPGQTGQYCIDIMPPVGGTYNATLTINSNGVDSGTQQVALTATAVEPIIEIVPFGENTTTQLFRNSRTRLHDSAEQCFLVKNIGPGQLYIYPSSYIDGDYPNYYRISHWPVNLLDSGETDTMCVMFAPQEEGFTPAWLHIESNASNGTQDMQLRGTGVRPCIVATPAAMLFDSVIIGDTICNQLTIENPCTDTLYLTAITLSSDPDFTMEPLSKRDSVIPPGQTRFVTVCFRPLARGTRTGRIVFFTNIPRTFEDPQRDTSIFYVDLGGTGVPIGRLYADIEGLGFTDSTLIGKQICRQDTIFNIGDGDFIITKAHIRGADSAHYTLSGITLPYLLKSKSHVVVTICARPTERRVSVGQLYIAGHTDGIGDTLVGDLRVKGLLACATHDPTALWVGDTVFSGTIDTALVTIVNCGDVPATYAGVITGPDATEYTLVQPSSALIAPNDTAKFNVVFHPSTRGEKSGLLRFTAPDIAAMNVQLGGLSACAVPTAAVTVAAPTTPTALTNPITFWVVISNTGNLDWNIGTPLITGDTVFHFIAAGSATVIPAGGTDSIKISFHPHEPTIYRARITFPEAGPCSEAPLQIDLVGEGFTSSVKDVRTSEGYILEQNVPNPVASGITSFSYTVPQTSQVRIVLADVTGKTVNELVNVKASAGTHEVQLSTSELPSGTYLYIMEAGNARLVRQLVVTK